jgi:hypothetical protein
VFIFFGIFTYCAVTCFFVPSEVVVLENVIASFVAVTFGILLIIFGFYADTYVAFAAWTLAVGNLIFPFLLKINFFLHPDS